VAPKGAADPRRYQPKNSHLGACREIDEGIVNRSKTHSKTSLPLLTLAAFAALLLSPPGARATSPGCGPDNIFSNPDDLGGVMCSQFYGLCIGAPCDGLGQVTPTGSEADGFVIGAGLAGQGDIVEHALCKCPYINGNSIGKASCADRTPQGTESISTYSFQFNNLSNQFLVCDQDEIGGQLRFADCYNQPCETDPLDPTQVICKCPVFRADAVPDKTYMTRGGDCRTAACAETIWSAVPPQLLPFVDAAMSCGIGIPEPPPKFICGTRRFTPVH
jgi:hypothetical protein